MLMSFPGKALSIQKRDDIVFPLSISPGGYRWCSFLLSDFKVFPGHWNSRSACLKKQETDILTQRFVIMCFSISKLPRQSVN